MTTRQLLALIAVTAIIGGAVGSAITLTIRGGAANSTPVRGQLVRLGPKLGTDIAHVPFCVELHHFCITQPQEGQLLALYTAEPHQSFREQGCTVRWDAGGERVVNGTTITGLFRDPCGGSIYDIAGARLFGPSPRDLDRFPIAITQDGIVVNTKTLICKSNTLLPTSIPCVRAPSID